MTAVRWTPGMRSESGWMVYDDAHGCLDVVNVATGDLDSWTSETLPDYLNAVDMTHAGTRGEVLEQAREAGYHDAHLTAWRDDDGRIMWGVLYRPDPVNIPATWLSAVETGSPTKAEALVAALESAP